MANAMDAPFGGFVDMPPIYGVKSPKTPNFGALIGHFKPNWRNLKHDIIETTALIPTTKFCTAIKTPTALRGWSEHATNKSKMADNRHIEKLTNR